jgi:ferredoxin-NADP reductase
MFPGGDEQGVAVPFYTVHVLGRRWLNERIFEIRFDRPPGFDFVPGQKVGFRFQDATWDYTLLGPTQDQALTLCVRHVAEGRFSPRLAAARTGDPFQITAVSGFFTFRPSPRPAVFVATGTGVAPFVAFARAGVRGFDLLHGVRLAEDLVYGQELASAARSYRPCLSGPLPAGGDPDVFAGRVDAGLSQYLASGMYDFYLCGNGGMIRDVMRLIDERFPDSRVFTETFFYRTPQAKEWHAPPVLLPVAGFDHRVPGPGPGNPQGIGAARLSPGPRMDRPHQRRHPLGFCPF